MSAPTVTVRERPILFSGPMIRAILDGRKTQTRRVVNPQPPEWISEMGYTCFTPPGHISGRGYWKGVPGEEGPAEKFFRCPFGQRGDRLWVRETWGQSARNRVIYRASPDQAEAIAREEEWVSRPRWRPSIHMPRWASRITLEITDVRVERVQEISEADARAEGVPEAASVGKFRVLWDEINERRGYGWDVNPWVFALSFRRAA